MNSEPLISVILPIYNVEKYLDKCMESLIGQSYSNLEILMVDDGSTDGSGMLCDEYKKQDERVVVYHKQNGGISDARNYGVERARGKYITWVDSDDYVDLDYVEYLLILLKKYKAKMAIAQHRVCYVNGRVKEQGGKGDESIPAERCIERMLYHDVIDTAVWGKLYDKSLFDTVVFPKGKLFEDIGTIYSLMLQCDYIAVGYESKYNYVIHKNSIVNGGFAPNKFDLMEMTDKMAMKVKKKYPELEQATLRRQVYARFSTLNQMLNVKGYDRERKEILDYIKANAGSVVKNPKTPKRDKVALALLFFNYNFYKFVWIFYKKMILGSW